MRFIPNKLFQAANHWLGYRLVEKGAAVLHCSSSWRCCGYFCCCSTRKSADLFPVNVFRTWIIFLQRFLFFEFLSLINLTQFILNTNTDNFSALTLLHSLCVLASHHSCSLVRDWKKFANLHSYSAEVELPTRWKSWTWDAKAKSGPQSSSVFFPLFLLSSHPLIQ